MSTHQYTRVPTPDGSYDLHVGKLSAEIAAALPGLTFTPSAALANVAVFTFDDDLDASEIAALDALAAAHKAARYSAVLNAAKHAKRTAVNTRTAEIITGGFTFQGVVFSTSMEAQKNISEMRENKDALSYPFLLASRDDSSVYAIANAAETEAIYQAGLGAVVAGYQSGNALKAAINAATTFEELAAIEDLR